MSDNLLQKLEEKMMALIAEVEELRKAIQYANQENLQLKMEKETHAKKLQELVSLMESISVPDLETGMAA